MKKEHIAFLTELITTPSPTGFESTGQAVWAKRAKKFSDTVESDAYGTNWATVKGKSKAPTIMIEAHADEIGFMIKHITDDGFIRLERIGGSDTAIAQGRKLTFAGRNGPVQAVIGCTAIHLRDKTDEKPPELHQIFVDVGASNRLQVESMGLFPGSPAVYNDGIDFLPGDRIVGRALDNRIGGYILTRILENLSDQRPNATVIAVNAVQEEIGGFGAKMITERLKPDLAIVLDVTHATDTPGLDPSKHGRVILGNGPTLSHGAANHPALVSRLETTATNHTIPIQHESTSRRTGTDTDQIYWTGVGVPSALISLPLRYMHTVVETVSIPDIEETIRLFTQFIYSLNGKEKHL